MKNKMQIKDIKNIIIIGPKNHIHLKRSIDSLIKNQYPKSINVKFLDIISRKNYLISLVILVLKIKLNYIYIRFIKRESLKVYAHQAHSYGLAALLSGTNYDLVCWGSDVFDWYKKNKRPKKYVISVLITATDVNLYILSFALI